MASLKKIPTEQVQLGMFLQAMEGPWLSHPFWRTRFVLRDPADLKSLKESGVHHCWIDTDLGDDVGAVAPSAAEAAPPAASAAAADKLGSAARAATARTQQPVPMSEEVGRAVALLNRSRQKVVSLFGEARLGRALDPESCLPLVDELNDSVARNASAVISLARLKNKDDYTYMHSVAVCALMIALSRQLGLDETQTRLAGLAGLLHDIGKMAMPVDVLQKPGNLTPEELAIMRSHPVRGFELLREGGQVPEVALDVCLHHHEKMDGTGYPRRLSGDAISLMARMGAVCDVYDAITSNRPYKQAWDPAQSLTRMAQWQGHFDPAVFQAFVKCIGIYPVGALVRLESGRMAVVVEQSASSLIAPKVKVFYSAKTQSHLPPLLLDLSAPGSSDRILSREEPAAWGFGKLDELWMNP